MASSAKQILDGPALAEMECNHDPLTLIFFRADSIREADEVAFLSTGKYPLDNPVFREEAYRFVLGEITLEEWMVNSMMRQVGVN